MDLTDIFRSCFRRWYVVIPILLLSAWIGYRQFASVKIVYYGNTVIGIAPPSEQVPYLGEGKSVPRNGLLDVGGAGLLANMAVIGLGDDAIRKAVIAQGGSGNYTARMFPAPVTGAGAGIALPLIMLEATEGSADLTRRTLELVGGQADVVMLNVQRQAGVPDPLIVRALSFTQPNITAAAPSRYRKLAYTIGSGLAVAVLTAVGIDLLAARRSTRRTAAKSSGPEIPVAGVPAARDHGPAARSRPAPRHSPGPATGQR